jgi:hypothetical protein
MGLAKDWLAAGKGNPKPSSTGAEDSFTGNQNFRRGKIMDEDLLINAINKAAGYNEDEYNQSDDPAMRWGRLGRGGTRIMVGPESAEDGTQPAAGEAPADEAANTGSAVVDMSAQAHRPSVIGPPKPVPGSIPNAAPTDATANSIGMKLAAVGKAPTPPQLDANYQPTMDHERSLAAPLPRYDANGKVLPQYRLGVGGRIMRGVTDLFRGGIPEALTGAVRPDTPGSYGRGAVNNRYYQDEQTRQQAQDADEARLKSYEQQYGDQEKVYGHQRDAYNDEVRKAYQQDVEDRQRASDAEKMQHNMETESLRQQMNDMNQQSRAISYDQASGRFMRDGQPYVPRSVEEGVALEAQAGVRGRYTQLWMRQRRNQPENRQRPISALEQRKLETYAREHGAKNINDLSHDQINDALQPPPRRRVKPAAAAPSSHPEQKSITRAAIQELADRAHMDYKDAEKQFTDKGYKVQ